MRVEFTNPTKRDASPSECLRYDPDTGKFFWLKRPRDHFPSDRIANVINSRMAGKEAGSLSAQGYVTIRLGRRLYMAHRIAWEMSTGRTIPRGYVVDHKNQIKTDNRIENLRLASRSQNLCNSKKQDRPLAKGVYHDKKRNNYTVCVEISGRILRARVRTLKEAEERALTFRTILHGEFACEG